MQYEHFSIPTAMKRLIFRTAIILFLSVVATACVTNIAGRRQIMLVPESQAINASRQAYVSTLAPFKKGGKLDNNPALVKRVNRITRRLIKQAEMLRPETRQWDWSVKVIDDPKVVNAWCMAGGKMAFYSGLTAQLHLTDDEIAEVMGHEISHALLNHTAEQMSLAIATGLVVGMTASKDSRIAALASAAAVLALKLPNSRQAESEADRVGIELAAKAGYNPNAAVSLWRKMTRLGRSTRLEFLSTHPSPKHREKALQQLIPKMMPYYIAASRQTNQ